MRDVLLFTKKQLIIGACIQFASGAVFGFFVCVLVTL